MTGNMTGYNQMNQEVVSFYNLHSSEFAELALLGMTVCINCAIKPLANRWSNHFRILKGRRIEDQKRDDGINKLKA